MKTDVGALKTEVGTMRTEVCRIKSEAGTMKNKFGALEIKVGSLQGQLAAKRCKSSRTRKMTNTTFCHRQAEILFNQQTDLSKPGHFLKNNN